VVFRALKAPAPSGKMLGRCHQERDSRSLEELKTLGWRVLTLWECEIKSINLSTLKRFLDEGKG